MPRSTLVFVVIVGFLIGVLGAATFWSVQHGVISNVGAQGYLDALRTDLPRPGIVIFLLFWIYWSFAARDRAADQSAEPPWSTNLHRAFVVAAAVIILFPFPGLSARFLPSAGWTVFLGLVVELAGVIIAVPARRELGRNWSSSVRIAEDHQLVRTGPYRWIRHPIYTGVLLLYLGLALEAGRLSALAGIALVTAAYWRKIGLEERALADRFGPEFAAWRKASWALIPPLL